MDKSTRNISTKLLSVITISANADIIYRRSNITVQCQAFLKLLHFPVSIARDDCRKVSSHSHTNMWTTKVLSQFSKDFVKDQVDFFLLKKNPPPYPSSTRLTDGVRENELLPLF